MRIPRFIFVPFIIISILVISQNMWKTVDQPSVFDLPKTLETERYSIELFPISNANGVAIFSTSSGRVEQDYLYLTPATDSTTLPPNLKALQDSGYTLKVTGSFYKGKGIPAQYFEARPAPQRLRVFRFEKAEMVYRQNKI